MGVPPHDPEPSSDASGTRGGEMPPLRLPPVETTRWVVRRKAEVIAAINSGLITREEACARYRLSEEELRLWERAIAAAGLPGLRVTRVQIYRPIFEALD